MAPPPRVRFISRESVPGAPAWMEPLLQVLNEGMGQTAAALARGLTFSENHVAELKEVTFTAPAPVWTAPVLASGWSNFGGLYALAGYRIDFTGTVHLRGTVVGGSATIFTLPAGYWPATRQLFGVHATSAEGRVDVEASGNVLLALGTATYVQLDGLHFQATTPCAFPPLATGWPLPVKHSLPYVGGVVPVGCRCLENVGNGSAGTPSIEWERAEKSIRLRSVSGLVPGRKYKMQLLLFAG